ncbi:DNA translocase FtsK 4TM domain-containing protein [Terriglobus sp.]|uniref:FtsK/SpoIIIE family DNA translocase n=1 Tax=Terriglobus sp. TaxID=1889013 RepID=UPI003B00CC24
MRPLRLESTPTRHRRVNEVLGMAVLVTGLLLLLALVSYHPGDPSLDTLTAAGDAGTPHVNNWAGRLGASVSDLLLQVLGVAAFALPLLVGRLGVCWIRSRAQGSPLARTLGMVLWLAAAPVALALLPGAMRYKGALPLGGVLGAVLAHLLLLVLAYPGACVVAGLLVVVAVYLSTTFTFNTAQEWATERVGVVSRLRNRFQGWRDQRSDAAEERSETRREREFAKQQAAEQKAEARRRAAENGSLLGGLFAKWGFWRKGIRPDRAVLEDGSPVSRSLFSQMPRTDVDAGPEPEFAPLPAHLQHAADTQLQAELADAEPAQGGFEDWNAPEAVVHAEAPFDWLEAAEAKAGTQRGEVVAFPGPRKVSAAPIAERVAAPKPEPMEEQGISFGKRADENLQPVTMTAKSVRGYKLPPSSLLYRNEEHASIREDALRDEARVLVEKCGEFGVDGQVTQINPGPVVTTFEFRPDAGVKYSRVTGLADDLCLAMAAESILIERMAGKSTVGIQVPNGERETIWLRDVVESEGFANSKSKVEMAMGKDINGRIVTANLAAMPHVLIAGSTGSGKSVAINAMIMSVLFKATPEQVRMILVDPKRVELGMYEGIPHLFTPIITEPKLAANALRNAVREMERRLKLLASRHVRNLDQYNKLFESGQLFNEDGEEQEPLPYIMIIIDELADLMMLDKANVEESITRLAQMARAVGIHLVLATQRPSVDVITGLIKANVPTRMSFRLATKVDSRTIIDSNGAESLLGRGDMLFLPPGTSRLQRVHAPFVTEKEISDVVSFWRSQGEAEYVEGFLEGPKDDKAGRDGADGSAEDDGDELFDDAVRLVFEFGKASTSLLQRRLRIGYGRAAHLIDLMERDGLVGPADGSRPREILKRPDFYREVDEALR